MHETGMIRNLLNAALGTASEHGTALRAVTIRLGALAGGTADHLREHFEQEISRRQLGQINLDIVEDPNYLGGVQLVSVDLARQPDD